MRRYLWLAFLALLSVCAHAQFDAATVLGTVTDPSGAVVTHGSVTLSNTATGTHHTASLDEQGQYHFIGVPVGPWHLKITAEGFRASEANFQLSVGARQRVDAVLKVASEATSVVATAEAVQLETDSSEHGQVVAEREIAALPLNGREYSQLVELSTGVVPSPSQNTAGYQQREGSFNINGLRSTFNNFLLDGVDNNSWGTSNQGFSNQVVQLPPDSVAEFQVATNNMSAEYGHSGGGTINAVTRYGTNDLHGRVWGFIRDTSMNATAYPLADSGVKPALRRQQFGGNLGGPLLKDKLFYFVDYEGYREYSSTTDTATLPTATQRGTNSSYAIIDDGNGGTLAVDNPCPYNGANPCNSATYFGLGLGLGGTAYQKALGGTQYLTGAIPSSAIIPFAAKVLSYLPATTNNKLTNNYVVLHPVTNDRDKGDIKIDYDVHPNLRLFTRYSQSRLNVNDPGTIPGIAGGNGNGHVQAPMIAVVGGATWTINPVSVLEARFGFSRVQSGKVPELSGGSSMYDMFGLSGLPTDPKYTGGITFQSITGFTGLGRQGTSPQHQYPTVWNPKLNYTRQLSRHSLKTGVEFTDVHVEQQDLHPVLGGDYYAAYMSGYCYYAGCYAAYGSSLYGTKTSKNKRMFDYADFLLGYRAEMVLASPMLANIRTWGWSGYAQDDWRVNHRLTVNLGLRYEFFTPIYEANNRLANFDLSSGTPTQKLASDSDRYTINPNKKDFAPRVGASYSLNAKTVLRGGFGISYVHWNRIGSNYLTQNAPYGILSMRMTYPSAPGYRNTQSGYPTDFVSTSRSNYLSEATLQYMPKDSPDAQVRSWFFGVQRDLGHSWMLDVSYVGNHGLHEDIINDVNQASVQTSDTKPVSLDNRRPYQGFSSIVGTLPWATSDYNGLQAKIEKRFSQGLYVLDSFTWSKDIDITGQSLDGGGNCTTGVGCGNSIPSVQNIYNWKADRGLSAYNYPLVNVASVVWALPLGQGQSFLSGANRVLNQVASGWQATAIYQSRSGEPLTFAYEPTTDTGEVSPTITVYGRNAYRPTQSGAAIAQHKSHSQYFNTSSFSDPDPTAPFGNSPRNAVRGYSFNQVDLGLTKDFHLHTKTSLQFRVEAFNLLNHTNYQTPDTDIDSETFGEITTSYDARQMQIALKLSF